MKAVGMAAWAAFALLVAGSVAAQQLETEDGLVITLVPEGSVTSLATEGRSWAVAQGAPSGLMLRDVAADGDFVPAGGEVGRQGDALVHSGTNAELKLAFEAAYRATPKAIGVTGFIHDTSGQDRAITVRFALPVDAVPGTWWSDIDNSQPISDQVHGNLRQVGVGASGKVSRYPWGAVSCEAGELCLGVPLDRFVVHRIEYDGAARSFYVDFDFGLSAETEAFPSRADFSLVIFTADPEWGFRSAAAKYYEIFPDAFVRRAEKEGLWMPFTSPSKVEDPEDFNFIFHEGSNDMGYDDAHGIYSFPYVSPHWAWLWMPDVREKPTREFVLQRLAEVLADENAKYHQQGKLVATSAAVNADGEYHFRIGRAHWAPSDHGPVGWFAMFPANADPDLEQLGKGETTGGNTWRSIERVITTNEERGVFVDGIYFDGVDERPLDNYSREHFRFADSPLTFGTDTRRPMLCGAFASYKFLRKVAERMHSTGRMTMANGVPSQFPFSLAYLDAGGRELEPSIDSDPVSVSLLAFARTLHYHKPYLLLYKPRLEERFDRDLSPYLVDYMNTCLLYAAEPSLFKIFSRTNLEFYYSFFERPDWYNKYRPIFVEYLPLVRHLALAGWEPVTHARCDDERILLERFGSGTGLNLVAYNPQRGAQPVSANIEVALGKLGWPAGQDAHVADLADGSILPAEDTPDGLAVNVTLPPRRSVVLVLRPAPSNLAELDLAEAVRYIDIAADRVTAKIEQKLAVDFESDPDGDGAPEGFGHYMHPPGSAGYFSDTAVYHSAPRATKIVLYGEARGTQSTSMPVTAGRKYIISAWAKAEFPTPGLAHIYAQWKDKGNQVVHNEPWEAALRETSDWTLLRQEITAPEKAESMSLVMVGTRKGEGDATVWFDDPRVVEVGEGREESVLLPMQPGGVPASAEQARGELRAVRGPLEALLDSAREGAEAAAISREALSRAAAIEAKAASLREETPDYGNVAAALDTCEGRLRRAARILVGWRMSLTGRTEVAQGEAPRLGVELGGASMPVQNVRLTVDAPQGWRAGPTRPVARSLKAGEGARTSVELRPEREGAPGGTVAVTAVGEIEGGHRIELRRELSFEIVAACQTSLVQQAQEDGGRAQRLLLTAENMRAERPLAVEVSVSPPTGFASEFTQKTAEVEPGGRLSLPIVVTAQDSQRTGWREMTVAVSWDGGAKRYRHAFLYVPPTAGLLVNGDLEQGDEAATSWSWYGYGGYVVDTDIKRSGARSLRAANTAAVPSAGASQRIVLNQEVARPLVLRGWSLYQPPGGDPEELKTVGMTEHAGLEVGDRTNDYSLYVDLHYVGGGALYGQSATFDESVIGWQFSQKIIHPQRPVADATVYLLFRRQEGTAWFDDVFVAEANPNLALTPGTKALTDSSFNGYTPAALIDGVVDPDYADWTKAAWASAEGRGEHWAEVVLPEAMPVQTVVIYWSQDAGTTWTSRDYSVQVLAEGDWREVARAEGAEPAEFSVHTFAPVTTDRVRLLQAENGGAAKRPQIMWLNEIEVY